MEIELRELIIAIAVVQSGGDLKRLNLPAPEAFSGGRPNFVPVLSSDHDWAIPYTINNGLSALNATDDFRQKMSNLTTNIFN